MQARGKRLDLLLELLFILLRQQLELLLELRVEPGLADILRHLSASEALLLPADGICPDRCNRSQTLQ